MSHTLQQPRGASNTTTSGHPLFTSRAEKLATAAWGFQYYDSPASSMLSANRILATAAWGFQYYDAKALASSILFSPCNSCVGLPILRHRAQPLDHMLRSILQQPRGASNTTTRASMSSHLATAAWGFQHYDSANFVTLPRGSSSTRAFSTGYRNPKSRNLPRESRTRYIVFGNEDDGFYVYDVVEQQAASPIFEVEDDARNHLAKIMFAGHLLASSMKPRFRSKV